MQNEKEIDEAGDGSEIIIVLNQTCFYAESGGQIGDTGEIITETGKVKVTDTQKFFGNFFIHFGKVLDGVIKNNQDSILSVNTDRKDKIRANHSATHLLHAALRETLGNHVAQRGSYVGPDRLRFDFSHTKQIDPKQIDIINKRVNYFIEQDTNVLTRLMTPEKAIKEGAMALFGEKYGDEVRVVSMGTENNKIYSLELCGGTHVKKTSDIGKFQVINESSISSGVRRIEALRGNELSEYLTKKNNEQNQKINELSEKLKEIVLEIKKFEGDAKNFENFIDEKQISEANNYLNTLKIKNILSDETKNITQIIKKKGINILTQILIGFPSKEIRNQIDKLKNENKKSIIFVISIDGKKTSIGVGVNSEIVDDYDAAKFAKELSNELGGKGGGGRRDFAQSGGGENTVEKVNLAFERIIEKIT